MSGTHEGIIVKKLQFHDVKYPLPHNTKMSKYIVLISDLCFAQKRKRTNKKERVDRIILLKKYK